jgi:glycine cleavage system transcriptional repressor
MVEGADHPGIVHKVTLILCKNGLSIDKMETSDEIAPHGGTMLFKMKGRASALEPLASGFDVSKIKKELAELGDSMNCDISMNDAADDEFQGSFHVG